MKKKHLLGELSKADYVTVLAVLLIVNAFWLLWNGKIELAVSLAFISMFLDYLDGVMARLYGGSPYGKVLDSLYDVLGWVLFPATVINIEADWAWWSILITTVYCAAAALRLSRFTIEGYKDKMYYTGLPVLFSQYALLFILMVEAKISLLILLLMTPLMLSSHMIRKPHPFFAWLEPVYAVVFLWLHIKNA